MRALVHAGGGALELRDVADPAPGPGEAVVAVAGCGICGSDMHAVLGHDPRRPPPIVLGHEVAGRVGGRRVAVNPLVACGACAACRAGRDNLCPAREILSLPPRPGGFAEAAAVPEANLVDVPEGVSDAAASLAEPMAVSWHAVRLGLAALHPSMDGPALVIGGGAIGAAAALVLADRGRPAVVVEPNAARRAVLAARMGLDARADAPGDHPLVIDAVGLAATRVAASAAVRPGGAIVHLGLAEDAGGVDVRRLTLQEVALLGAYTYTARDFRDCCAAMWAGRLGPLDWTETRPLADGARAFADLRAGRVAAPKLVLAP